MAESSGSPFGLAANLLIVARQRNEARAALARVEALADQWNGTPDYIRTEYDQGRVDQRHDMTQQLLAAILGDDQAQGGPWIA